MSFSLGSGQAVADPSRLLQFRTAYDIQPLLDRGIDGRGETVSMIELFPGPTTPARGEGAGDDGRGCLQPRHRGDDRRQPVLCDGLARPGRRPDPRRDPGRGKHGTGRPGTAPATTRRDAGTAPQMPGRVAWSTARIHARFQRDDGRKVTFAYHDSVELSDSELEDIAEDFGISLAELMRLL